MEASFVTWMTNSNHPLTTPSPVPAPDDRQNEPMNQPENSLNSGHTAQLQRGSYSTGHCSTGSFISTAQLLRVLFAYMKIKNAFWARQIRPSLRIFVLFNHRDDINQI